MNFFQRLVKYLREVRMELKKVHWPSRRELLVYTGIVLVTVLVVSLFFWLMDTAFLALLRLIIR
ncbi:MAG TPA: preprotein translocase subunit SecE [Bacillota bacterium]|nr:preprotein translocase subunit SecE [Bacillota bacterium]HOB87544.1 preprotein translocase subunit SecE [Bacillota bacterium]HOP69893.1 preprotein translocase subunit SecE [Bacillota bacterium]HPT33940.1 preprotein translocase subunit SecE [Bacillota bacterium]HPZ65702.1 preprotein translocase subunit SecE [Bacillota bacterium]